VSLPLPYSYRTYSGDGSNDVFAVPFPYIVREHVKVFINWTVDDGLFDAELLDGVGFDWVGDTSINTTVPVANTDTISVVRITPIDQRVTQWQAGSPPTAFELTAADEQVLFVVQEFVDRVLVTQGTLNVLVSGEGTITGDGTVVVDNLLSSSATSALSANQGRILKALIDAVEGDLAALDAVVQGIISGGGGGGGGGTTLATTTVNFTAPDVADLGTADFTIPVGELAILTSITLSHPGWLRLFRSAAQRTADTRLVPGGVLQAVIDLGDSKPYAEFVTTTEPQTIICNPVPSLKGDATTPTGLVYARLVNQSGATRAITGNLTIIQLEA